MTQVGFGRFEQKNEKQDGKFPGECLIGYELNQKKLYHKKKKEKRKKRKMFMVDQFNSKSKQEEGQSAGKLCADKSGKRLKRKMGSTSVTKLQIRLLER